MLRLKENDDYQLSLFDSPSVGNQADDIAAADVLPQGFDCPTPGYCMLENCPYWLGECF